MCEALQVDLLNPNAGDTSRFALADPVLCIHVVKERLD